MKKYLLLISILIVMLVGGFTSITAKTEVVILKIDFSWEGMEPGSNISPEIRIANTPPNTAYFVVELVDLDVQSWNHGGGKVASDGTGVIPKGALKAGYNGPNPPSGSHNYEFRVKAFSSEGVIIGQGRLTRSYPSAK